MSITRPDVDEYAAYYGRYVSLVPDEDVLTFLRTQREAVLDALRGVDTRLAGHRYAPDKWSTKEVVGHVVDVEWVFTHRGLWFARRCEAPLPGMDQDDFVSAANFDDRSLADLLEEFAHLRSANIVLFESFDERILNRSGEASECRFTVRSIPYIIAGHAEHHLRVLRERYLSTD